jgi:hypothetical protein
MQLLKMQQKTRKIVDLICDVSCGIYLIGGRWVIYAMNLGGCGLCTDMNKMVFCNSVAGSEERFNAIENSSDGRPADIDTRSNVMINVRSLY